jgi:polyisoprenoid-binding protein YceI
MRNMPAGSDQVTGAKPRRRRRWVRWVLGALLALVVIVVVAVFAAVRLQSSQPPLALPAGAAAAPAGQLDGTWRVATGSVAGFRVRESILGIGNDVTGRTGDVTGTATVAGGLLARAAFHVSLNAITVNGKAR